MITQCEQMIDPHLMKVWACAHVKGMWGSLACGERERGMDTVWRAVLISSLSMRLQQQCSHSGEWLRNKLPERWRGDTSRRSRLPSFSIPVPNHPSLGNSLHEIDLPCPCHSCAFLFFFFVALEWQQLRLADYCGSYSHQQWCNSQWLCKYED